MVEYDEKKMIIYNSKDCVRCFKVPITHHGLMCKECAKEFAHIKGNNEAVNVNVKSEM